MVNYPTILNLPQEDINRQLYEMIIKAESGDAKAIKDLQDAIGSESTANTILKRIKDIEDVIGNESTENTIIYMITAIAAEALQLSQAIGSESDATSILGRIKALEDAS